MDLFTIEALPLSLFIDNQKLKLPRYQRKDTWKSKQNFDLSISIFQGYPIGVCIVNRFTNVSWLLDGRQRRTALTKLYNDPVEVYDWATSYCKIKPSDSETAVREKFWGVVNSYLDTDRSDEDPNNKSQEDGTESDIDGVEPELQTSEPAPGSSLEGLLNLILMVHQKKGGTNDWYKAFNFSKFFVPQNLKYYPMVDGERRFDSKKLCAFIREADPQIIDDNNEYSQVKFITYCEENMAYINGDDATKKAFHKFVAEHWEKIRFSFATIINLKNVIEAARIGVIYLSNVDTKDAQNIFSRINSGGTQLTAAELLSAKPYWNIQVDYVFPNVKDTVSTLYKNLGVQTEGKIVRWDIPATLISQIDKKQIVFSYTNDKENEKIDVSEISLGFKIVSSYYEGGMSKVCLDAIEKNDKINWQDGLCSFANNLRDMIDVIYNGIPEFVNLKNWNTNLSEILGAAPTIELLVSAFHAFEEAGCPSYNSTEGKAFISGTRNHFDRLIIEKASGLWKGSGDSKMAKGLSNYKVRRSSLSTADEATWKSFIDGAVLGMVNAKQTRVDDLKPLLYYANILSNKRALTYVCGKFDIDHIIPQSYFASNDSINKNLKEAIGNLALLPASINKSKKDKWINEVTDKAMRADLSHFEDLSSKYDDNNIDHAKYFDIITERGEIYKEIFETKRKNWLNGLL